MFVMYFLLRGSISERVNTDSLVAILTRKVWANTYVLLVDNFKLTMLGGAWTHQFKGVAPSMQCKRTRLFQRSDGAPGFVFG